MTKEYNKIIKMNYSKNTIPSNSRIDYIGNNSDSFFVTPSWLNKNLNCATIIEVVHDNCDKDQSNRVYSDYIKSHIPTAFCMIRSQVGEVKGYFKDREELSKLFKKYGLKKDSIVVFYSNYSQYGLYIASRVAFAAYLLGYDKVKILDGGYQGWNREGYALESGENIPKKVIENELNDNTIRDILISTPDDLLNFLKHQNDCAIVSIRSWNEYSGINQGISFNKGVGEIYGALYGGDVKLTNSLGYISNPKEYLLEWNQRGITKEKNIILYCGTAWRAATSFFILKQLDWENVFLFDGSWLKWYLAHSEYPNRYPIQIGVPYNIKY